MNEVTVKINGVSVTVPSGTTILEAAKKAGFDIPTLCYMKELNEIGACRICVVELKGAKGPVTACVYPCDRDGMEITTNSPAIMEYRRKTLQLIMSTHDMKCTSCIRNGNCELAQLCKRYKVTDNERYAGERKESKIDTSMPTLARDNNRCILCRRCVAVCNNLQGIGVIGANNRGFKTEIGSAFKMNLGQTACVGCGQCIAVCPTGGLKDKESIDEVLDAIADPNKVVIAQTAPAVRAALGECFDYPIGTDVEGKMVTALKYVGFDKVFDTDFGADLTIMEEATELLERIKNGGTLPMITSCSPGWVNFCEHYYPDMTENLSSCKSPHQMLGAIIKSYWAEKNGIDPKNIVVVSIMPCTAKKMEIDRPDEGRDGMKDVDYVLTTRELGRLIQRKDIIFNSLPDSEFDSPIGQGTGAAVIFGATGGVMEAALRSAQALATGENSDAIDFKEVRGFEGIKEATYTVAGIELHAAVASGLKNAAKLLDAVKSGEKKYEFLEIMCCPGGCVNGGGQPQQPSYVRNFEDIRTKRASVLYSIDSDAPIRRSHENPDIKALYDEYLKTPGSETAHHLLHTTYQKKSVNNH